MPSLHAKHSRSCTLERLWTKPDVPEGCSCAPTYYVVVRQGRKSEKIRAGKNRREAERALRKLSVQVDEGTYRPRLNIRFEDWGERWLASLERKETTRDSYTSTIKLAKPVFGSKLVRQIRPDDIARFSATLRDREKPASLSTRAKHLRVLGACFASAIQHGYAGRNPVRDLPRAERPRAQRKESAYFENEELVKLFAKLEEGLFKVLFEVALKTGARQGELLALTWGDLDLSEAIVHVRRTVTDGHVSAPKNHERRDVDITPDLVELLGAWWGECGKPNDDTLVFPGEGKDGYLTPSTILKRELYPAMTKAKVPREGPTGEKRTFHSFRHTFARVALENGADLTWLRRHLGHSSLAVTEGIYGHWSRAARKAQAKRLKGVFGI